MNDRMPAHIISNPGDWKKIDKPWVFSRHAVEALRFRYNFTDEMLKELENKLIRGEFVQLPEREPKEGKYMIQTVVGSNSIFMPVPLGEKVIITAFPAFCHFEGELLPSIDDGASLASHLTENTKKAVKAVAKKNQERRDNMISLDQTYYEFEYPEDDGLKALCFAKEKEAQKARDYLGIVGAPIEKRSIRVAIFESFGEFEKEHEKQVATAALAKLDPKEREIVEAFYRRQQEEAR